MKVLSFDIQRKNKKLSRTLVCRHITLVIARNTQTAKDYLKYIQEESEQCNCFALEKHFNIKFNRDKGVCITYDRNNQNVCADGQKLKSVDKS